MNELLCKVIIVGEPGVGKTSLIQRYTKNLFRENYKTTIGVDFALKTFNRNGMTIKLQLWDIAGQEQFNSVTRAYCKDALGVVVVFDVARQTTSKTVANWKEKIDSYLETFYNTNEPIPAILIANKIDLAPEGRDWPGLKETVSQLAEAHQFIDVFETSAKESLGIDEAMNALIDDIVLRKDLFVKEKTGAIRIAQPKEEEKEECDC